MKKFLLLVFSFGLCLIIQAQTDSVLTKEVTLLKKQVIALKSQNYTLKQELQQSKTYAESISEKLNVSNDELNARIQELTDSLSSKSAMIDGLAKNQHSERNTARINHTLLFLILIAAIIGMAWMFQYFTGKIKAGTQELKNTMKGQKEETEADMNKLQNDFQSKLMLVREGFDQKSRELEKHLHEMEVRH